MSELKEKDHGDVSFNGAAAHEPRKSPKRGSCQRLPARLQWGRGSRAAEVGLCDELKPVAWRFNGATAHEPRKCEFLVECADGTLLLQWGRGSRAAEVIRLLATWQ